MDLKLILVLAIMITAGVVGGTINYFLNGKSDDEKKILLKSIFSGIGASFLVPLFLKTISSNILFDIFKDTSSKTDYFVYASFCLLSAISSRAFIQTISDKILKEAKEAKKEVDSVKAEIKDIENAFNPIIDSMTEQDIDNDFYNSENAQPLDISDNDLETLKVLTKHPRFTIRSLTGITNQLQNEYNAEINRENVRTSLLDFKRKGFVVEIPSKHGTGSRWSINFAGKQLIERAEQAH